mmetsp:Transcript_66841/g.161385  ORF Transcript_66841/g.161385 Transcript_66841/m.161385 type:complete len:224 (-) Transcript_66841:1243-1914(-)
MGDVRVDDIQLATSPHEEAASRQLHPSVIRLQPGQRAALAINGGRLDLHGAAGGSLTVRDGAVGHLDHGRPRTNGHQHATVSARHVAIKTTSLNLRSESTGESKRAATGCRVVAEAHVPHVQVHVFHIEGAAHVSGLAVAYLRAMEVDVDTKHGRLGEHRDRAAVVRRLAVADRAAEDRETGCLRERNRLACGNARREARAQLDSAAVGGAAVDQRHVLQREL